MDTVFQAHDVHDQVDALHHSANNIIDKHCPLQPIKIRSDKPPWMTETITKLIRARETAHKNGCKSYKVIKALVQRRIRGSKRQFINETLNKESDTKSWCTAVKKLTNQSKNSSAPENAIIDGIKLSSAEFSEQISDFYINVGGNALPPSVDVRPDPNNKLDPLSIGETKFLLKNLIHQKPPITKTFLHGFPKWAARTSAFHFKIS